jgi:hypothetical protein
MNNEEFKKKRKSLTEKAESFIMDKDEKAEIIIDGQLKEGATLLMEFVWSLYEDGEIDI